MPTFVKAIEVQVRLARAKGDAKVEHLSRGLVHLWMCREWANVIESTIEVELATCLKRDRIQLDRQTLFTKGQKLSRKGIHTHVDRRLEHHAALQSLRLERSSESAEERASRLFLC